MSRKVYLEIKKLEYYNLVGILSYKDKKEKETAIIIKKELKEDINKPTNNKKIKIDSLIRYKSGKYINSYNLNFIYK